VGEGLSIIQITYLPKIDGRALSILWVYFRGLALALEYYGMGYGSIPYNFMG
jgi:hypothetical protein